LFLTAPARVQTLIDAKEIELKFCAPSKPGSYTYTVWLRSDSYLDCDQKREVTIDVTKAKPFDKYHPQWRDMISKQDEGKYYEEDSDEAISSDGE